MKCKKCNTENDNENKYCKNCGFQLSSNKTKKSARQKSRNLNLWTFINEHKLLAAIIFVLMFFLVYESIPHSKEYNNPAYTPAGVEGSIANTMSDSVVAAVVKKFNCSCGDCTDPLDVCTCVTAAEERSFIETKAAQNYSIDGIIKAVDNKYGSMKEGSVLILGG